MGGKYKEIIVAILGNQIIVIFFYQNQISIVIFFINFDYYKSLYVLTTYTYLLKKKNYIIYFYKLMYVVLVN